MGLIVFAFVFVGLITFIILRLSISCTIWASQYPKDKQYVFKNYFPYYIIVLFGICISAIIKFNANPFANYYFGTIFFAALLIWRREVKSTIKENHNKNFAVEPNHPNLP